MCHWLDEKIEFPPYELTSGEGIIALGGDLSVDRLVYAYGKGIFPWFNKGHPIAWYCPYKRMVLFPENLRVYKSMKKVLRKNDFIITKNQAFEDVILNCKNNFRKDQKDTWITNDMKQAYVNLHQKGLAKSIEVWKNDKLAGGLYGIDLGNGVFCGESMFTKESNMSKVAFIYLVQKCGYKLIDCQVHNNHLASLGAKEIPREEFLKYL